MKCLIKLTKFLILPLFIINTSFAEDRFIQDQNIGSIKITTIGQSLTFESKLDIFIEKYYSPLNDQEKYYLIMLFEFPNLIPRHGSKKYLRIDVDKEINYSENDNFTKLINILDKFSKWDNIARNEVVNVYKNITSLKLGDYSVDFDFLSQTYNQQFVETKLKVIIDARSDEHCGGDFTKNTNCIGNFLIKSKDVEQLKVLLNKDNIFNTLAQLDEVEYVKDVDSLFN